MPKRYCHVCDLDSPNFDICEECNGVVCQKCMADGLQVICRSCILTELTRETEAMGGYAKEFAADIAKMEDEVADMVRICEEQIANCPHGGCQQCENAKMMLKLLKGAEQDSTETTK